MTVSPARQVNDGVAAVPVVTVGHCMVNSLEAAFSRITILRQGMGHRNSLPAVSNVNEKVTILSSLLFFRDQAINIVMTRIAIKF